MRGARTCQPSRRTAHVPTPAFSSSRAARDALPYYREALDAVDRLFANTRGLDESVREGFIAQYTNYYQEMTELLLRLHGADGARGHDREALAVVSRTQSRLFTELLRQADIGRFSADPAFLELKRQRQRCWSASICCTPNATAGKAGTPISRRAKPGRMPLTAKKTSQHPRKPRRDRLRWPSGS